MTLRMFTFYYFLLYINDAIAVQEIFCKFITFGYGFYQILCSSSKETCVTLICKLVLKYRTAVFTAIVFECFLYLHQHKLHGCEHKQYVYLDVDVEQICFHKDCIWMVLGKESKKKW